MERIEIEPIGIAGYRSSVKVNGNPVHCTSFCIKQDPDSVAVMSIEVQAFINVNANGEVKILNKDEIAKSMSVTEFQEFCDIWNDMHKEQK